VPSEILCPACTTDRTNVLEEWPLSGKKARAVMCRECGLLFVDPQPPQAVLDAYYAPDGGWQQSRRPDSSSQPPAKSKRGSAALLFRALDEYFPATAARPGARVFDFGCGPGSWLNAFEESGWETYGLEPSTSVAFPRHTRLEAIPTEPRFDLVFVYHVFEHLPHPLDTIRQLAGSILPGGYLFTSVPRLDTLAVHTEADYCLHPTHHIAGYTEACLRGLLARAGLATVATFHELDDRFTKGVPLRLRLLARKSAEAMPIPTPLPPDPAAALTPVIEAFMALRAARIAASEQ
jgi:SAM-dependent methyltransferase